MALKAIKAQPVAPELEAFMAAKLIYSNAVKVHLRNRTLYKDKDDDLSILRLAKSTKLFKEQCKAYAQAEQAYKKYLVQKRLHERGVNPEKITLDELAKLLDVNISTSTSALISEYRHQKARESIRPEDIAAVEEGVRILEKKRESIKQSFFSSKAEHAANNDPTFEDFTPLEDLEAE